MAPRSLGFGQGVGHPHFLGRLTLTVVTLYGLPRGPTWPRATQLMTEILEFLTKTFLFGHSGLIAIQGDFNFSPEELPHFHQWRSMGWIDAQSFAKDRWNHEWQPTCKGAKERDLIWMSPALASLCRGVSVCDVFSDHSSVSVTIDIPEHRIQYWAWLLVADSTQLLAAFGAHFEESLTGHVPGVSLFMLRNVGVRKD